MRKEKFMNIYVVDFENVNSQGLNGIDRLDSTDQVIIFYSENADSMTFDLHEQINKSRAYIYFQKVDVGTKNALDFQLATYLGYMICENEKADKQVTYYLVSKDRGYLSLINYWTKRDVDIVLVGSLNHSMKLRRQAEQQSEQADLSVAQLEADSSDPAWADNHVSQNKSENITLQDSNDNGNQKVTSSESSNKKANADNPADCLHEADETENVQANAGSDKSETDSGKSTSKRTRGRRRSKSEQPADMELRIQVEKAVPDKEVVDLVVSYIKKYKTKLGINNALAKEFKDSKKASEIYKAIKPLIADKKGQ